MRRIASGFVGLFLLVPTACSSARSADEGTAGESAEQALRVGYTDVNGHWERSVDCDGAHFDRVRTDDQYTDGIYWQLVITDPGAVGYLNGKVEEQKRSSIGLSVIDASNVPHGQNEIVVYIGQIYGSNYREGVRAANFSASTGFGGNEANIMVDRYDSYVDQGGGNFRKANDVKVTYQRNGWSDGCTNFEDATGICRQYSTGGTDPKPGWGPFEISNWVFRGCTNR
jgi:hypothetical protein